MPHSDCHSPLFSAGDGGLNRFYQDGGMTLEPVSRWQLDSQQIPLLNFTPFAYLAELKTSAGNAPEQPVPEQSNLT